MKCPYIFKDDTPGPHVTKLVIGQGRYLLFPSNHITVTEVTLKGDGNSLKFFSFLKKKVQTRV